MACAAPSKAQATVFLSHAGEQKKVLVDFLYNVLTEEGISVFMDEPSLVPGTSESRKSIVEALRLAAVVVVVLSPEFVRKACPMEELAILLTRQRADPGSVRVLPVWYGITYQQCCDLEAVYEIEENWVGGEHKPAPNVMAHWAGTVRELLKTTAVRDDQFCGYIGRMAFSVRALVVQHLIEAKLLPAHYVPRNQLEIPMQLHRIAQPLLGREAEVQQVLSSLVSEIMCWPCSRRHYELVNLPHPE